MKPNSPQDSRPDPAHPSEKTSHSYQPAPLGVLLVSLVITSAVLIPIAARAALLGGKQSAPRGASAHAASGNLQTLALLHGAMNLNPTAGTGGGEITIVDNSALMPDEGPSGTIADIEKPANPTVSTYIVRQGDTVASIAKMFGVSQGTIRAANGLSSGSVLRAGDKLDILPVTGIDYTVKKGDTLESIAKHYGGDAAEIAAYNGVDNSTLAVGAAIIIPNGEVPATAVSHVSGFGAPIYTRTSGATGPSSIFANNPREPAHNVGEVGTVAQVDYYIPPIAPGSYTRSQGIHGYNAVDLAAPRGTPIVASAAGDVVVARQGGWNGGYGSYVVISHDNDSQTLYAHMSKVATYDGAHVEQGEVIGYVGSSGEATGPHVHFEIRNGIRNPF